MKKTCLITGGLGFLGSKFCKFFLEKNYNVICVDNDNKKLKNIKKLEENYFLYKCDISKYSQVKKLFKNLNKYFQIDVLINNAAIDAIPKSQNKLNKFPSEKSWEKEIGVGLKGNYFMTMLFGESMAIRNNGSIINIGSDLSIIAPNQKLYRKSNKNYIKPVTYSVTKHGCIGLTKYFASLYAEKNVRVNMVSPGPILNNQNDILKQELLNIIPMKRLGNPSDIFGLLFFLASEESSFLTGQNILIDGGKTII